MRIRSLIVGAAACALALASAGCQGGTGGDAPAAAEQEPQATGSFEDPVTFEGQQNVELDEAFEGDGFSATLTGYEVMDEVQPANPNGYYVYMEDQDGSKYLVVHGEVTNTGDEAASIGDGTTMSISSPALLYTGNSMELSAGTIWAAPADGSTLGSFELEPGASCPFMVIATLSDDQAASLDGYKMFFTVDAGFDSASFSTLGSDEIEQDAGGDYVFCIEL